MSTTSKLALCWAPIFGAAAGGQTRWPQLICATIVALAPLARRSDFSGWQSATNTTLGLLLVLATVLSWLMPLGALMLFWIHLWVGLTVACLALWAALYHPERQSPAVPSGAGVLGEEAGRPIG